MIESSLKAMSFSFLSVRRELDLSGSLWCMLYPFRALQTKCDHSQPKHGSGVKCHLLGVTSKAAESLNSLVFQSLVIICFQPS